MWRNGPQLHALVPRVHSCYKECRLTVGFVWNCYSPVFTVHHLNVQVAVIVHILLSFILNRQLITESSQGSITRHPFPTSACTALWLHYINCKTTWLVLVSGGLSADKPGLRHKLRFPRTHRLHHLGRAFLLLLIKTIVKIMSLSRAVIWAHTFLSITLNFTPCVHNTWHFKNRCQPIIRPHYKLFPFDWHKGQPVTHGAKGRFIFMCHLAFSSK